jgi:hypothetical protein
VFFPPKLSEIPELPRFTNSYKPNSKRMGFSFMAWCIWKCQWTDIKKVSLNFEALKGGGRVKDERSVLHEWQLLLLLTFGCQKRWLNSKQHHVCQHLTSWQQIKAEVRWSFMFGIPIWVSTSVGRVFALLITLSSGFFENFRITKPLALVL